MILGETNNLCSKNDNYNASVEALDNIQEEARNKIIWPPFYCDESLMQRQEASFYLFVPSHFGLNWGMAVMR